MKQSNGKQYDRRELWPRGDDGDMEDTDARGNDDTCGWSGQTAVTGISKGKLTTCKESSHEGKRELHLRNYGKCFL